MDPMELQAALAQALRQQDDDQVLQAPQRLGPAPQRVSATMGAPRILGREADDSLDPDQAMDAQNMLALQAGEDALRAGARGHPEMWTPEYIQSLQGLEQAQLTPAKLPTNLVAKR